MSAAMIDLETLSTKINTTVLTLGGIMFDPYSKDEPNNPIYIKFDADQQIEDGRHWDQETIEWWGKQDKEVQEEAMGGDDRLEVIAALTQVRKWVHHADTVWANGSIFDIMILENMCDQYKQPVPWNYYNVRDVRTVLHMGQNHKMDKSSLHNALADAYQQAIGVQNIFNALEIERWAK